MNLDRTFCISPDCENHKCDRRLSYSVVRAAESRKKDLSMADFTDHCDEYIATQPGES